jgi:DNA polymerase elongation subunit (family B)
MKKNGVDINLLSPIKKVSFNPERYAGNYIYGLHFLDLLEVYKSFTYNQESSYKLGAIARKELGKDKIAYDGTLDNIYINDINKFIEYSYVDTELLFELEQKLRFIELLYEMIRVCSSTWNSSGTTMGLIDPLVVSYAKKNGYVCKDTIYDREVKEGHIEGAYVRNPIPGLHSFIVDFDFSSLYPSTIVTYNMDPSITLIASIEEDLAYLYIYKRNEMPDQFPIVLYPYKKNNQKKTITLAKFNEFLEKYKCIVNINGSIFLGHEYKKSFIAEIVKYLLDSRKEYREKMKQVDRNSMEYSVYSNRQLVYKITNNSIYGVLANKYFRFFNERIAEAITKTGQEVSKFVQYHLGYYLETGQKYIDPEFIHKSDEVIPYICYGDTDSMFVNIFDYLSNKHGVSKDDPDIINKVLQYCKELQYFLNNELLVDFVKLHNIKPENSILNLKQEVIADRALFPNVKKRYCLHIINKDGVPVDEYDIKGICIKRSEYPDKTKMYIKELLDLILLPKKLNFLEIKEFIENKKREMFDL